MEASKSDWKVGGGRWKWVEGRWRWVNGLIYPINVLPALLILKILVVKAIGEVES